MEKMTNTPQDWELSEDFYSQEEGKKWKLEDFLEEDSGKQEKAPGLNTAAETGAPSGGNGRAGTSGDGSFRAWKYRRSDCRSSWCGEEAGAGYYGVSAGIPGG